MFYEQFERYSIREFTARAEAFRAHIHSLPWQEVKLFMHHHETPWEHALSVILGVKPAAEDIHRMIVKIIPPSLRSQLVYTNAWLIDKQAVGCVLSQYQKYFPDYNSTVPVERYVTNPKLRDHTKVGLVLGFPLNIVLAFAQETNTDTWPGFIKYGFSFHFPVTGSAIDEVRKLYKRIKGAYQESGMNSIIHQLRQRVAENFRQSLSGMTDTIRIVSVGSMPFLEVQSVDHGTSTVTTEVLPLTQHSSKKTLNLIARHYHAPLQAGRIYHNRLKPLVEKNTQEGKFFSIIMHETPEAFILEDKVKTVDPEELKRWLTRPEVAAITT